MQPHKNEIDFRALLRVEGKLSLTWDAVNWFSVESVA